MKYINTFETIHENPKVGDYIICIPKISNQIINKFISSEIGLIVGVLNDAIYKYSIRYDNIPDDEAVFDYFNGDVINMSFQEIDCWSDNKEELEFRLRSSKYNI